MSLTQSELGSARPWPADRPERWPIERLIPYANNARVHTEADLAKIVASIAKWGWTMPVPTASASLARAAAQARYDPTTQSWRIAPKVRIMLFQSVLERITQRERRHRQASLVRGTLIGGVPKLLISAPLGPAL